MNVVLCGMMGVGKTTVGIRLAELTGMQWCDTDAIITDRYGKISDIFANYGEAYFRNLETDVVREMENCDRLVVSTGGGLVIKDENRKLLKRHGKIVFLKAELSTLIERAKANDSRPLLKDGVAEKLRELLEKRTPIYEGAADLTVQTDGKDVDAVCREIIEKLQVG